MPPFSQMHTSVLIVHTEYQIVETMGNRTKGALGTSPQFYLLLIGI